MNLSKVKLIVSDMDGTLLNSKGEVSSLFFNLFDKLKSKGIHFCAASGRQYHSITNKLSPIKNDIFVIAENGAIAKKEEKTILLNTLTTDKVIAAIRLLRNIKNIHIVLCTGDAAYIENEDPKFINILQEYYTRFYGVKDLIEIAKTIDILKIAIYHDTSSERFVYPLVKQLENDVLLKISGQHWLDISDKKANKGNALKKIQKQLHITKEQTLVFGDYHNDIEMLKEADFSFAMENAHKDIIAIANYTTSNNDDLGVEKIIQLLLKSLQ